MGWLNVASSTLFLSNAAVAHALNQRLYSALFLVLTATSWGAHWGAQGALIRIVKRIDKVMVYAVVGYGAYYMLEKGPSMQNAFYWVVTLLTTTLTAVLYFGGACFDPEYGVTYHAYLHALSCLAHHAILAMV